MEELELDMAAIEEAPVPVQVAPTKGKLKKIKEEEVTERVPTEKQLINCLRDERITVRFIKKETTLVPNQKHVLFGGMAETAVKIFTVPLLRSGTYKNVLTNDEKDFLEAIMDLPKNTLSIYNKVDNYWANYAVRLTKNDSYLDLNNPEDYIRYKVLLANEDLIAPSLEELARMPKVSYQFVLIADSDEIKIETNQLTEAMNATEKFAEISNDKNALRYILEVFEGRPISAESKLDFLKTQLYKRVQSDPKRFLFIAEDPLFKTKVMIRLCVEHLVIRKRGDFYYRAHDNTALCAPGQDPTLDVAAAYLNKPAKQELKLALETELKTKLA